MTEQQIIEEARDSVAACNWSLGRCAHEWTQRWANGRTDGDFAAIVGSEVQAGHVGRCRRVWIDFAVTHCAGSLDQLRAKWPGLSWSHFDKARSFGNHALECLAWAALEEQTVRGMQAWGRSRFPELSSHEVETPCVTEEDVLSQSSSRADQPVEPEASATTEADPKDSAEKSDHTAIASEPLPSTEAKATLRAFLKSSEALVGRVYGWLSETQQREVLQSAMSVIDIPTSIGASLQMLQWCAGHFAPHMVRQMTAADRLKAESAVQDLRQSFPVKR